MEWTGWSLVALTLAAVTCTTGAMKTFLGTSQGADCIFPFLYQNVAHFVCTEADSNAPWCATDELGNWGYCGTTDCLIGIGMGYIGQQSINDGGETCDPWGNYAEQFPIELFPGTTYDETGGYCRNPDGDAFPWCITLDGANWGYCSLIPPCLFCEEALLSGPATVVGPFEYSSSGDRDPTTAASKATLLYPSGSWCSAVDDANQWIQVDLVMLRRIEGIVTQGAPLEDSWVTAYKVTYGDDGVTFQVYQEAGIDMIYSGNGDRNSHVPYLFTYPFFAQYVRLLPQTFSGSVCMRFDVIGCSDFHDCAAVTCLNGGTCQDLFGTGYECVCTPAYLGQFCEIEYNDCMSNPCLSSGTCVPGSPSGYTCTCQTGYTGINCELGSYDSCLEVAQAGITDSGPYGLDLYLETLPSSECSMTYISEAKQTSGLLDSYGPGVSNCQYLCLSEPSCVACRIADLCYLYSSTVDAEYAPDSAYYVKDCPGIHQFFCDLSDPLSPVTHIAVTGGAAAIVNDAEPPQGLPTPVTYYGVSLIQIEALKNHSIQCEQELQVDCMGSTMTSWGFSTPDTFYSMHSPGADCYCRLDYACTDLGHTDKCECDIDDLTWRLDKGNLTGKHQVPIITVHAGDTGDAAESASYTVGPLRCSQTSIDDNQCASSPCQNSGVCVDGEFMYTCDCASGYTGVNCEADIDECLSNPCQHAVTCLNQIAQFVCVCEAGYTGEFCQLNIDDCVSQPCMNGGSCSDMIHQYRCLCKQGFVGEHCETDLNECISSPCVNGGTCLDSSGHYECQCLPGYTDVNCGVDIDECDIDPCVRGNCVDLLADYACVCPAGYTDKQCQTDINECDSSPCQNGATCIDEIGLYVCTCDLGYTGTECQINIDECVSSPCYNGGTCVDGLDGYTCSCEVGFTGDLCEAELDECQSQPCQNGGTCTDAVGGYDCSCKPQYTGADCQLDIDDCADNPCSNGGTCTDVGYGFQCACLPGYAGETCLGLVIAGQWGGWGAWSECSAQCGAGVSSRIRQCNNPPPQHGGTECAWADAAEAVLCTGTQCINVDGKWSGWGEWSSCSHSCGEGVKWRTRQCNNPPPDGTGVDCEGVNNKTAACIYMQCGEYPVDGNWGPWSQWSTCSTTCGVGTSLRVRRCDNPPAAFGGVECAEDTSELVEAQPCYENRCPLYEDCDEWEAWSACSSTCGDGIRTRERYCRLSMTSEDEGDAIIDDGVLQGLTEYEHAHCEDVSCGDLECYHCSSVYDGTVDSLACKGPRKSCPADQSYCMYTFQKTGAKPGIQKGCANEKTCDTNVTEGCNWLYAAAIDAVLSYDSTPIYPLEPHYDTVYQMWAELEGICNICCSKSRCNRGILPPGNTVTKGEACRSLPHIWMHLSMLVVGVGLVHLG